MRARALAADRQSAEPRSGGATRARLAWASAAALGAIVATAATVSLVPAPWLGALWLLALAVLAPTAADLDRRLATNVALTFGFVPMTLWLPPVAGAKTAAVAVLSVATGCAVFAGVARPDRALPVVRRRDAAIPLAGLLAGLVALPMRSPDGPHGALAMLSTGIDNAYHYAMFLERRLTTAGSSMVAANTDGSGFAFSDYPQWFHKLITVLAQIAFGDPGDAPTELVRFAQLEWVVFVAVVILVTAAFLQALPEDLPLTTLVPALAVVLSLLLGVPGSVNLVQGHLSFLMAACAPLVMFLLANSRHDVGLGTFVVLAGLFLVAASWILLVPMAAAAVAPPIVAYWRRQGVVLRWSTLSAAVLLCGAVVPLFVLGPLTHGAFASLLRDGTVARVGLPAMLVVLVGSPVLLTWFRSRTRTVPLGAHLLIVMAAAAQVAALGAYMAVSTGQLTYYFWKLGLSSLIVTVVVTTHALIWVASEGGHRVRSTRRRLYAAAVVVLSAIGLGGVLQQFGAPSAAWAVLAPTSLSARQTSAQAGDVALPLALAARLSPQEAARTRLIATRPTDMNAAHASEWFHALSHSATRRAISLDDGIYELALHRHELPLGVRLAVGSVSSGDGRVVVTDPELYRAILSQLPASQRERVSLGP